MKTIIILFLSLLCIYDVNSTTIKIYALVPVEYSEESVTGEVPVFSANKDARMYVFGENLTPDWNVGLSKHENCSYVQPAKFVLKPESKGRLGLISFTAPSAGDFLTKVLFHICVMQPGSEKWTSQGSDGKATNFYVYQTLTNVYVTIFIIIICFMLSSLMSGLNLGLMSLDQKELLLLKNAGTKNEKKYAKKIIPIRKNGNFLLCTIVVTGTLCNAISTVSIDTFASDSITIIISTIVIVLFCEILPQSICTYYPLEIGAHTVYITIASMIITGPITYPLSKIFNLILGNEMAATYSKARLRELLKLTELPKSEEIIISGTLDLSFKKVEDVMTPLDDIFKLPISAILNLETVSSILASGYSRIPIYSEKKSNISHVLLTKDLAVIDPNDNVPVRALVQNSKDTCAYIPVGTTVDKAFGIFKESKKQMAFIVDNSFLMENEEQRVIGLITFEDVIEEIFQSEINDETDIVSDNRIKKSISDDKIGILSILAKHSTKTIVPPEPLKLATYHFLSSLEVFSAKYISPKVLLNLLDLEVFHTTLRHISQDSLELYVQGKPADYFIMVLEGHMEVKFGPEELTFEAGPFRYFGIESLKKISEENKTKKFFVPDYSLKTVKKTMYLKISSLLYESALLATEYERSKKWPGLNKESELFNCFKQLVGSELSVNKKLEGPGTSKQN